MFFEGAKRPGIMGILVRALSYRLSFELISSNLLCCAPTGDYLEDLFDEHGSVYNVYNMYSDLYITISPEHIKLMLATDFQNFVKGTSPQRTYWRTASYLLCR